MANRSEDSSESIVRYIKGNTRKVFTAEVYSSSAGVLQIKAALVPFTEMPVISADEGGVVSLSGCSGSLHAVKTKESSNPENNEKHINLITSFLFIMLNGRAL